MKENGIARKFIQQMKESKHEENTLRGS